MSDHPRLTAPEHDLAAQAAVPPRDVARRPRPRDRRLAFRSRHGLPVLAGFRRASSAGIRAREIKGVRAICAPRAVRGRVAARRPVQRWIPQGSAGKPVFVFETGGTTGMPKTRVAFDDFRTDYELFSATLPDEHFPEGRELADARSLRPARASACRSSTSRSTAAASASASISIRAGSIKLIKKGWSEHLEAYKDHVIDQAVTILQAGHDIRCMFTTPKLLEVAGAATRVDGHDDPARRASPGSSPAAPSSRRSGTASRTRSCSTAPT